ncbi:uncharacterized protein [Procambarus clarkii]|uniref:uncharacterized protein n=1 Tax=Procambarus clarkii TaxID=6728 RepID=UPI0037438551
MKMSYKLKLNQLGIGECTRTHTHEGVLRTHTYEAVLRTHTYEAVLRTHTYEGVLRTHTYEGVLRTHTYEAVLRTHTYEAVLRTHTYEAVLRTHTYEATRGDNARLTWMVVVLAGVALAAPSDPQHWPQGGNVSQEIQQENQIALTHSERDEKVLLVLLKIQPDMCATLDAALTMGTCMPAKDCTKSGGRSSGTCAKGYGVCCIGLQTCDGSTNYNNTYFVNPGYSGTDSGTGACSLTINRVNSNICQMRFDFLDFELAQPDVHGNCYEDFFTVTATTSVPRLCGSNDGQHMYINVDPAGGAVKMTVDRSGTNVARSWNIKVVQIPCDSRYKAPSGCLQYYTATSGTVYSFNFAGSVNSASMEGSQIADLDYGVCVEMADGYCGIIWERNTTSGNTSFTVSGNTDGIDASLIGTPAGASFGDACTTDYVIIPGGVAYGLVDDLVDPGVPNDRYCGLGFPTSVQSTLKPFNLYVHQNEDEEGDGNNYGFCLNYRQITRC